MISYGTFLRTYGGSMPQIDDGNQTPTSVRYVVLVGLCSAAAIAYLCRNSIGVAESTIRAELGLSEEAMSRVMGNFFLAYALGQIPMGWLGNRFGSRVAIPTCAIAWSLATAMMSFAIGVPLLIVSRLTNGLAQAGLFPACTLTIARWFPDTGRGVAIGSLASSMSVGGAVGVSLTGILIVRIGWRSTFAAYSMLGVVFAVIFYLWFRNSPTHHAGTNASERRLIGPDPIVSDDNTKSTDWLPMYLSPPTWWICGQQFCRAAGQVFFASWFATYLQETRAVTVEQSGLLNSLPILGIVTGSLVGGTVSDALLAKTGSKRLARSGVAIVSMLLCALFVFCAYFIESSTWAVVAISVGTFCAAFGGPCSYSVTIDMGGKNTAVLFATMNMVGNLGAYAFIRVVPRVTEQFSWHAVLGLFGALYVGAAFFWCLIRPTATVVEQSLLTRNKP